ncbi:MAG: hypothetical protein FJX70_08070 [Alphaproteobacteria bacterium]|nr:hypothetical protein [Alphaproteobacteria bacterium]
MNKQYTKPNTSTASHNRKQEERYEKMITVSVKKLNSEEAEDPVKKFFETLAKKKEQRVLRELKNPYDW